MSAQLVWLPLATDHNSLRLGHYNPANPAHFNINKGFDDYKSQDALSRQSLTPTSSDRSFDHVVFDVLKVEPENFAKQITLIEFKLFKRINIDEFLTFKWNSRDKMTQAPNIVASTKWFNQLNFWTQKEILQVTNLAKRIEVLSHFIRIAKHLLNLNNLYSSMAIFTALQVQCIYRLTQTWAGLSNKDRNTFKKLDELLSSENNSEKLREFTQNMKIPGIPYLGLYLSDLTYINAAHPAHGESESQVRKDLINNILRVISGFQQSNYQFPAQDYIQHYLRSQLYIEEVQKFTEDYNYQISLQLEPESVVTSPPSRLDVTKTTESTNQQSETLQPITIDETTISKEGPQHTVWNKPNRSGSAGSCLSNDDSLAPHNTPQNFSLSPCRTPSHQTTTPGSVRKSSAGGHRKSKSVGASSYHSGGPLAHSVSVSRSRELDDGPKVHLLDDSVIDAENCQNIDNTEPLLNPTSSIPVSPNGDTVDKISSSKLPGTHSGGYQALCGVQQSSPRHQESSSKHRKSHLPRVYVSDFLPPMSDGTEGIEVVCQGCIQRKVVKRVGGGRAIFSMWRKYWAVVTRTRLEMCIVYFKSKPLGALTRKQFWTKTHRIQSLRGLLAVSEVSQTLRNGDDTQPVTLPRLSSFQLVDPTSGKSYLIRSCRTSPGRMAPPPLVPIVLSPDVDGSSDRVLTSTQEWYSVITKAIRDLDINGDPDLIVLDKEEEDNENT